ncbi:hypothetical protein [Georgenia halophila]
MRSLTALAAAGALLAACSSGGGGGNDEGGPGEDGRTALDMWVFA